MNPDLIEEATNCLLIQDIRLNTSKIWVSDDFDPVYPVYETLNIQFRSGTKGHRVAEFAKNEPGIQNASKVLTYKYECALRVVPPNVDIEGMKDQEGMATMMLSEIEAEFVAYYLITKDVGNEVIEHFGLYNVGYHVWPYWREYVNSVATRLRLPTLAIPMYRIPKIEDSKSKRSKEAKSI